MDTAWAAQEGAGSEKPAGMDSQTQHTEQALQLTSSPDTSEADVDGAASSVEAAA